MSTPLLDTKLYIPPPRPKAVARPRLIERLDEGLRHKLTLISAPAGFGKTTLVSEWLTKLRIENEELRKRPGDSQFSILNSQFKVAWLSLDEGDSDPARFLTYLVAALRGVDPSVGEGLLGALRSPQPPPAEAILTALLNQVAALPQQLVLVLDDYHVVDARPVDAALTFLLEHLPPQLHLVITTREDPQLPLARLRARSQLTELRAADLRFTAEEAATFLNRAMGLRLSAANIAALEMRTEGWIAGLQLAALSMQGHLDIDSFIRSFAGSHRFVLDYLLEEVLHRQPQSVQSFLLRTSILERMCGPLCDALTGIENAELRIENEPVPHSQFSILNSQLLLEKLERANLFIVPLDSERRWYRYHHLFADLLRQRLRQGGASSPGEPGVGVDELHRRASAWFEDNGLEIESFQHAAAAGDVERAERLIEGRGMPLQFRGALGPILGWLKSLPATTLDARPSLWVTYASVLLATGQTTEVEWRLQAAEAALQAAEPNDTVSDQLGRIAATRATLALSQHQLDAIIAQSRRALEYLHPDNLPYRTSTTWKLGYAFELQGDRAAAGRAYAEAVSASQASGNTVIGLLALTGLGNMQEVENQLALAAETYRRILELAGDLSLPAATCESQLGLARICYEWNDLEAAERHAHRSLELAPQLQNTDRLVVCELFLARLKLAHGDPDGAGAMLARAAQLAHQHNFVLQLPHVAAAQVLTLLRQGHLAAAADLAKQHDIPLSQARVYLAQGNPKAALAALEPLRQAAEARGWQDERLNVMILQALALHAHGSRSQAAQVLAEALALAEPGGFIRLFVDEGAPMVELLSDTAARGTKPAYVSKLLAACRAEQPHGAAASPTAPQPLDEPLSQRELEILRLIAEGLSNDQIGKKLFLALDTVKGHNRRLFGKLHVQRRTEAVARARELGLL